MNARCPRRGAALAALALAVVAAGGACDRLVTNLSGGVGPEAGLLRGKMPVAAHGVSHAARLTDGIAASPGDPAHTDLTAQLAGFSAHATWDLGAETPVRCALLDADGAGRYALLISSDGARFDELWTAPTDEEHGQQLRAGRDLQGHGRYLRLRVASGRGPGSVSEISAWRDCPKQWPPLAMQKGNPDDEAVNLKLWGFAGLAVVYVLTYRRRGPDWAKLLGAVPAGLGVALAVQVADLWPPSPAFAARLAGSLAAIGAAVALRWLLARRRPPAPAPE
jgi:hypothetical protein